MSSHTDPRFVENSIAVAEEGITKIAGIVLYCVFAASLAGIPIVLGNTISSYNHPPLMLPEAPASGNITSISITIPMDDTVRVLCCISAVFVYFCVGHLCVSRFDRLPLFFAALCNILMSVVTIARGDSWFPRWAVFLLLLLMAIVVRALLGVFTATQLYPSPHRLVQMITERSSHHRRRHGKRHRSKIHDDDKSEDEDRSDASI